MKSMGNKFENSAPKKEAPRGGAREVRQEPLFDDPNLVAAHAEMIRIINAKRIQESAFASIYESAPSDGAKARSMQIENELKQTRRERESKAIADLLEGLVYRGINPEKRDELSPGWLGMNAKSIPTALSDDIHNGIDQIVCFHYPETNSHAYLGLAIDVTTGNASTVSEKMKKIKMKIDSGTLGTAKYFSDYPYYHGTLPMVAQAVVGFEPDRVKQLALNWQARHESLGQCPEQRLILIQMKIQMETFGLYAKRTRKPELAQIFSQNRDRLKGILDTNLIGKDELQVTSYDEVFHSIHQALQIF